MSTLITIQSVTAYHLPNKNSVPIPLAAGDLSLTVTEPAHPPGSTLTLTVGHVSFPLSDKTPVAATDTTSQHSAYIFTPSVPPTEPGAEGTTTVGQVKIVLKPSASQAQFDETEALARHFEQILRDHKAWHEWDYYEGDDTQLVIGAKIGAALSSIGHNLASRFSALTGGHAGGNAEHSQPAAESEGNKSALATTLQSSTATLAQYTHVAAEKITGAVQEGAKYVENTYKEYTKEDERSTGPALPTTAGPTGSVQQTAGTGERDGLREVNLGDSGAVVGTASPAPPIDAEAQHVIEADDARKG